MKRDDLVSYLDEYLAVRDAPDYGENGLQVEGGEEVTRVAFAVDACQASIDAAAEAGAGMLVVHHGLFWGKPILVVGQHRRRVKRLLDGGCSLYAVHLPLDRHPEVGNNVQLARLLGLRVVGPLGEAFGHPVGVIAEPPAPVLRSDLVGRLTRGLGQEPMVLPAGPSEVLRAGIISGGAARQAAEAAAAGCDTYLTGETSHQNYHDAAELGINVIFGGHYATETLGLRALADHLASHHGLETVFIDLKTGL